MSERLEMVGWWLTANMSFRKKPRKGPAALPHQLVQRSCSAFTPRYDERHNPLLLRPLFPCLFIHRFSRFAIHVTLSVLRPSPGPCGDCPSSLRRILGVESCRCHRMVANPSIDSARFSPQYTYQNEQEYSEHIYDAVIDLSQHRWRSERCSS